MERETQGADLVRLSSRGVLIRAERSGHNVQTDDPALVARTIQQALKAAREVVVSAP